MLVELARDDEGGIIVQQVGGGQIGRLSGRRVDSDFVEIVLVIDYEDYPWRDGCPTRGIELIPAVAEIIQRHFGREGWQWQRRPIDDLLIMQLCLP